MNLPHNLWRWIRLTTCFCALMPCFWSGFVLARRRAHSTRVLSLLEGLPHWNGGRRHVVLDLTDSPARFFDTQEAIVWKSAYDW
jgi:hypothetical protein